MFSKLVNDVMISPKCSSRDGRKISRITIHHSAGVSTAADLLYYFYTTNKDASANYVIGNDGLIGGCVPEEFRAWTSGSWDNDSQAITIEVSNSVYGDPWPVGTAAWNSTIKLCVDICRRYGFRLRTDKNKKAGSLTAHRWFQPTVCPGTYLYDRFELICKEVNRILDYDKKVDDLEKTVVALTSVVGDLKKTVDAIDITLEAVKQQSAKTAEEVLPVYKNLDAVPDWYHDAVETLVKSGAIQGVSSTDLHVNQLMARIFTILEREGIIMKGSDILKLAKAGFTIEQIVQIDDALELPGDPDVAAAAPADQVPIEPKPEEPKPEEPKPEEPKPENEAATAIKAATATLVDTLEKIQRANVTGLNQPAREEETTDSILASLITGPKGQ